MNIKMA